MVSKYTGNPKYVNQLEVYYTSINAATNASIQYINLSCQDKVILSQEGYQISASCCPITEPTTTTTTSTTTTTPSTTTTTTTTPSTTTTTTTTPSTTTTTTSTTSTTTTTTPSTTTTTTTPSTTTTTTSTTTTTPSTTTTTTTPSTTTTTTSTTTEAPPIVLTCIVPEFTPILSEGYLGGPQTASAALVGVGASATDFATKVYFNVSSPVTASFWARGAYPPGSSIDSIMGVFNPAGTLVYSDDDTSDGAWKIPGESGFTSHLNVALNQTGSWSVEVAASYGTSPCDYNLYITPSSNKIVTIISDITKEIKRMLYSQIGKKVFVVTGPTSESRAQVLNPITNIVENTYPYEALYDAVYNSVNDRIYLWTNNTTDDQMVELSGDGTSTVFTTTFGATTGSDASGLMSFNPDNNQILMITTTSDQYYIFDCATRAIIKSGGISNGSYSTFASGSYYISHTSQEAITKMNGGNFVTSSTIQESVGKIVYLEDPNILVAYSSSKIVFINPSTDTPTYSLPYSAAFNGAIFDPCNNAITTIANGTLRLFTTRSYQPGNALVSTNGFKEGVFVATSSRVYICSPLLVGNTFSIYSTSTTVLSSSIIGPPKYKICDWANVSASAVVNFPSFGNPSPEPEWNGVFTTRDSNIYYFVSQSISGVSASADHSAGWPGSLQFNFDYTRLVWNGSNTWTLDLTYNDGAGGGSTWSGTNTTGVSTGNAAGYYTASFGTPTHILILKTSDSCPEAPPEPLPAYCVPPPFIAYGISGSTTIPKSI